MYLDLIITCSLYLGMACIAAVLLMHLSEEEAFWALVVLLQKPKYLSELFDLSSEKYECA